MPEEIHAALPEIERWLLHGLQHELQELGQATRHPLHDIAAGDHDGKQILLSMNLIPEFSETKIYRMQLPGVDWLEGISWR